MVFILYTCSWLNLIQVLILAPTREIALQIEQVISTVGCKFKNLCCHCAIGGLSLKDDIEKVKRAHILIGTPGKKKKLTLLPKH